MQFTQQFWEYLKTAGPEFGQPDDASVGFLDDDSAVVTVQYILSAEQWDALEAEWEAQSALRSAEPTTTEVTEGPFYLLDQSCGVVIGDDDSLVEFDTEEEAERWANANLGDGWQIMEGNPFKPGELMDRPAKPAYDKVKVRALKLRKDMAK